MGCREGSARGRHLRVQSEPLLSRAAPVQIWKECHVGAPRWWGRCERVGLASFPGAPDTGLIRARWNFFLRPLRDSHGREASQSGQWGGSGRGREYAETFELVDCNVGPYA